VGDLTRQLNECNTDLTSAKTQVSNLMIKVSTAEAALTKEKGKTKQALDNPICPEHVCRLPECTVHLTKFNSMHREKIHEENDDLKRVVKELKANMKTKKASCDKEN